jgi:hypothetical protein
MLRPLVVRDTPALVDTGCAFLCIPESLREQLALEVIDTKTTYLADGSKLVAPYAGPVEVRLLGLVPMEDMNLVVAPLTQTLEYNSKPIRI